MDMMGTAHDDPLTGRVIGLAMKVHRTLGPGFLEIVYRRALLLELRRAGIQSDGERRIAVVYEGQSVGEYIADITVQGTVILELKAVDVLNKAHEMQLVHYLTATGLEVGLLLNFGAERLQFKRKHRLPRIRARGVMNGAPAFVSIMSILSSSSLTQCK